MERPLNLTEVPAPPAFLDGVGQTLWREVCAYQIAAGRLQSGDLPIVAAFCQISARHRALETQIALAPFTADGKAHPATAQANSTAGALAKLGAMLGLGPVSRHKMANQASDVPAQPDEWTELLDKPGQPARAS